MKKIFLSLLMALSLVGINCAKAQTQTPIFMGVWVLQNPEVAAVYSVVTFCENGIVKINVCTRYESVQPVVNPNTQKVILCEEVK